MMRRILIFGLLTVLFANLELTTAQGPQVGRNTFHPCPGGTASVEVHPLSVPVTLDQLVYMSKLIVVGTVARCSRMRQLWRPAAHCCGDSSSGSDPENSGLPRHTFPGATDCSPASRDAADWKFSE